MGDKKTAIFFAPHPDDETLGCGGTIAKKIAEGYKVLIVIMTDGRFLFKGLEINNNVSPEQVKEIRKSEVLKAVKILGVLQNNVVFLDFIDGTLNENEDNALEKVVEVLKSFSASEVYLPYEKDSHPDHVATKRVVMRAIERLGIKPTIYKYEILHKMARIGPFFDSFLNFFRHNIIEVDISSFLPLKERALKEFKSQFMLHTINFKKFLKKKEKFYINR
ncbi:MAG: PIG-L deacetylase family protein [Candidatus Aenigmatarchaeota archaeon]